MGWCSATDIFDRMVDIVLGADDMRDTTKEELITDWCITYDRHTMTSEIVLKFQAFPKYELCILTVGSIELSFRVR